jgi:cation diffusion facilitator CzcD-associated flavoprotein CzcO/acetyl esterase/lipase
MSATTDTTQGETVLPDQDPPEFDVVVVGAGMAGLYLLYRLRALGLSAVVLEAADDVGGTWYWNRYPGARCDVQSVDYSYSFDADLQTEWRWSEKYATQPEILRYLRYVADKHDLRRDVRFSTRVDAATWNDTASMWSVRTEAGDELTCRHYVMATGCLSVPKGPEIEGAERFTGAVHFTSRWPHEGVDFTGMRVGVIGTGSSGIQSIPIIASQASQVTVFQRTPNFSMPAGNGPIPADKLARFNADPVAYRASARVSMVGVPLESATEGALAVPDDERNARFERAWEAGELFAPRREFNDLATNRAANETFCEFVRGKIRSIVSDPETAETLCPTDHPFGTKRPCLDSNYYQTFNLPHVRLVDLRKHPIARITETGIDTVDETFELDAIVYATGFDAMTGALVAVDIEGRNGVTLKDKWAQGPKTYLGLTTAGFPNFFMVTGPGSPSVLSNMVVSIEQHVDWIAECLDDLRRKGYTRIEPTDTAESGWVQHVNDCADITLYPSANSWYMGANVPGKPRVFLPYVGGVGPYRATCDRVVADDYLGFELQGPAGEHCNDGVVNRLQPDVAMMLQMMGELGLPPIESLPVPQARAFSDAMGARRPSGPEVGEVVDGTLPGDDGDLGYRIYRPPKPGPHPIVAYFHGGGWVLGSAVSDEPFCRDLCDRTGALIISVDYRHAPETRFPGAADDAFAAVRWIADNAAALGGMPGQLAVAGWSAGANVAAVACQLARDRGGPEIVGQLLVTPLTDGVAEWESLAENADGFVLTASLLNWFWDNYADPDDRSDPKASPLRAGSLAGLPPAAVFTCEFDPLRDQGDAYAAALAESGVAVQHQQCRGHIHTSLTAVGMIISGAPIRAQMAEAIDGFFA